MVYLDIKTCREPKTGKHKILPLPNHYTDFFIDLSGPVRFLYWLMRPNVRVIDAREIFINPEPSCWCLPTAATRGTGGTCLMSRLGVGVMFTSSKVIPRILVSKVFHPTSFPQKLSGWGDGVGDTCLMSRLKGGGTCLMSNILGKGADVNYK